jgi:hypothetical protein
LIFEQAVIDEPDEPYLDTSNQRKDFEEAEEFAERSGWRRRLTGFGASIYVPLAFS